MASKPKSRLRDLFRSSLPRTKSRPASNLSPLPPSENNNTLSGSVASTQVASTASNPGTTITHALPATTNQSPATTALTTALEGLQSSLNGLPPLQLAVGGLLECVVHAEVETQNRQTYSELATDLTNLATILQKHVVESNPQNVPYSIANVARAITEQTDIIQEQRYKSKIGRLASALDDEETVLKCYRRVGALFQQLHVDISLSIWEIAKEQQMDTTLERLLPAYDAYHDAALPTSATQRTGCTEGTRVDLLDTTQRWSRQEGGPKIYWLNGMAGTGKTTIAYSLCEVLGKNKQLAASFFCSRNSPDCRSVNKIIPTIAYQLGRYSIPYRRALCDALRSDPDAGKRKIDKQFEALISTPLAEMGKAMPADVVVVIDALDECEDIDGTRQVLDVLLRCASGLPIKFFVASRPEPTISTRMTINSGVAPSTLRLHDVETSLIQADIRLYLTEALSPIHITPFELDQLIARSGSLFIFAATCVRYIIPHTGAVDHRQRLEAVLKLDPSQGHKSYKDVDKLYTTILSNAFDPELFEKEELVLRQHVLWTVVCAREPLTISALAEVLHASNDQAAELAIQPLQSVLHVSEGTRLVSTLHASFPDFLLSEERAERLCCDYDLHERHLAECCFKTMNKSLRFNICNLESSHGFDRDIPDLHDRVEHNISTGLFYVCQYWSDHLTSNPPSLRLLSLVESFLESHFLFWMEVLSLNGTIGDGEAALSQVLAWLPAQDKNTRLQNLTYDARNFITTFAGNPTSLSTPHMYISTLPFTSKQSLVHAVYWPQMQGLIRVEGTAMDMQSQSALANWVVESRVNCLALSNDGNHVASGSGDGGVSVWDISGGTRILGPLKGHRKWIMSVAYSPNDTRIASGSSDKTICIWDVQKGGLTAGPLRGHTKWVLSVAFSPDGSRLASGSSDQTIRIWDAHSGAPVGDPLKGRQGAVWSVVFSPDGEHLASGLENFTIRVWDWRKRTMAQGRFEGHTGAVRSIAYSVDGRRLVSGSHDSTVRVWDASNGTLLLGPFEVHTSRVMCVSFSPNGNRVVSGSWDATVRVWDAVRGEFVAGPFEGHRGPTNAVLFTADGTRVLSGSDDRTIRVWDARHAKTGTTESQGHTNEILSASLSPDGTRVASGSEDKTICVWDVHDGTLVAGPFKAHTNRVSSVAFSPDGARIASSSDDCTLCTWDASTGALLVGPIEGHTKSVSSVAFSPNGSQIASGSDDRSIRLWNSHTGESVAEPFKGHTLSVSSVAYSPHGARIVSGSYDRTVRMWDADNGTTLWTSDAHTRDVNCVAFSPDGTRVVSGSWDKTILVFDASDGAVLHGPFTGHTSHVLSVAFSPDGTHVISGSHDQTLWVWDVECGTTVVGPLVGHTGGVHSVACSPDGKRIISADGTVRIWDLAAVARANGSDDWSIDHNRWIDHNGWLMNSASQRLFWVPSGLRDTFGFLTSSTPIVINASCTTWIEPSTLLGDRWRGCWRPSPASP